MKKIIKTCTIVLIFVFLGHLVGPLGEDEDCVKAVRSFHEIQSNSVDVIVYDSSHAWKEFNPIILNEEYGIKAYNYGNNWQRINTTLLFWKIH